jgi:hypothetical protein
MPYTGFTAGSDATADDLNAIAGIWRTYTPTWTATTSNPSVGNGILEGAYALVGGLCHVRGHLAMGSTTTYGSGEFRFALPFTAKTLGHSDFHFCGSADTIDRAAAWHEGVARIASGGSHVMILSSTTASGGTPGEWNATRPFTWANLDVLSWFVTYEPA